MAHQSWPQSGRPVAIHGVGGHVNNVADYLKIAVIAFVGVWLINHGLKAAGMTQYEA